MSQATYAAGRHRAGVSAGVLTSLTDRIAGFYRIWKTRRRIVKMTDLDDRILDDIGLARGDLYAVLDQPFSQNPAFELQRIAQRNRSRRMR